MPTTFGSASAPSQVTTNLDTLFATSLANYKKTLTDNISKANAFFYEIKRAGGWESADGGTYVAEDLLYGLNPLRAYDGYDELGDTPQDKITQSIWEWRQAAVEVLYSEKERKQNKHRLVALVEAKIKQMELGAIEGFNQAFLQGSFYRSSGSSLIIPFTDPDTGALFIDPIAKLIDYTPTVSRSIGNINQSTETWWQNQTKTSAATTNIGLFKEFDNMYNNCGKGPGGPPNLILVDQTTAELLNAAYYDKYRTQAATEGNYPFDNIKFRKAIVVWDEFVPDVETGVTNTNTFGTAYFINTNFFKVRPESETDWSMTEFQKPPKQDARIAHTLWMGTVTMNNRRKQGVIGKIARTLS